MKLQTLLEQYEPTAPTKKLEALKKFATPERFTEYFDIVLDVLAGKLNMQEIQSLGVYLTGKAKPADHLDFEKQLVVKSLKGMLLNVKEQDFGGSADWQVSGKIPGAVVYYRDDPNNGKELTSIFVRLASNTEWHLHLFNLTKYNDSKKWKFDLDSTEQILSKVEQLVKKYKK